MIAIGEGLKNLDKITEYSLLTEYTQIDWKRAKAIQDIISNHYFDVNAESIYIVCRKHIQPLRENLKQIIAYVKS